MKVSSEKSVHGSGEAKGHLFRMSEADFQGGLLICVDFEILSFRNSKFMLSD